MKKYLFLIAIIMVTIIFCVCFIDINQNNVTDTKLEESITYGVQSISTNLECVTGLTSSDTDIICATSKGLVSKNEKNEIIPSLATEFKASNDGIQYEFKIRDDIFWSDGSKIVPEDIAEFLRQLLKEENEENINALLNVYGAKEYKKGNTTFNKEVAINYNDSSVIIRLNNKDDDFLSELTKPQYRLRKYLVLWENIEKNYNKLVYSGDYKIENISAGNVILKKNNTSSLKIQAINIVKDPSVEQSMAAYEVKDRDVILNPPDSELNKLSEEQNLITIPKTDGIYLVINNNNDSIPMQGRREIYNNIYTAIEEYQSKNSKEFELAEGCYFRENKNNLTNIQERKVNSNKESQWNKPEVLTIIGEDNNINRTLCRIIKEWFSNNTNITIKYSLVKDEEFKDNELKKKYDMIMINNEAMFYKKDEFYTHFEEYLTDIDKKMLEKIKINDFYGEYLELEQSLFNNYNIVPLCFENENIAVSNEISNLRFDGNGNLDFATIK